MIKRLRMWFAIKRGYHQVYLNYNSSIITTYVKLKKDGDNFYTFKYKGETYILK